MGWESNRPSILVLGLFLCPSAAPGGWLASPFRIMDSRELRWIGRKINFIAVMMDCQAVHSMAAVYSNARLLLSV